MKTTMTNLQDCFNKAIKLRKAYVGVVIQLPDADVEEVIINGKENFEYKMDYYKSTYDENLNHKHVEGLKIVAFTYGDSFSQIEYDLIP